MKKRNGFTLVELLAVIVILAIILVIAVPQIMDTINSAREASLESSVKMVAAQAENQYTVAQTLGNVGTDTDQFNPGSNQNKVDCGDWSGIDTDGDDYGSCKYYIDDDGVAHVEIYGKANGKFSNYTSWGCYGTRTEATCLDNDTEIEQ